MAKATPPTPPPLSAKASAMMALPPTAAMTAVGLDFSSIMNSARKVVAFLQDKGDEGLDVIEAGWRAIIAITERDLSGLLLALNDVQRTAVAVIDAFKEAFGL